MRDGMSSKIAKYSFRLLGTWVMCPLQTGFPSSVISSSQILTMNEWVEAEGSSRLGKLEGKAEVKFPSFQTNPYLLLYGSGIYGFVF